MYLRAEFENFKKQAVKERSDLRKYGAERLVADLLNVLDIFETALATDLSPENVANFRKGIELTSNELRTVLQRHGVAEVPSNGVPFDPTVHEALSSQETERRRARHDHASFQKTLQASRPRRTTGPSGRCALEIIKRPNGHET